jgi:hypothetical protein
MAVVVFAAVAGCTRSEAGQANPAEQTPSSPETASSTATTGSSTPSPTVTIPSRPRDLKLDGVEPCALFTDVQLGQLKIDEVRKSTNNSTQYKGMLKCVLSVNKQKPYTNYSVTLATNEGIAPWLSGKRNVDAKLGSVAGYPAATYWIKGGSGHDIDGCDTSVDVADGQQLMVDVNNDGQHSYALEELCQMAEKAAGFAVQTLQTVK